MAYGDNPGSRTTTVKAHKRKPPAPGPPNFPTAVPARPGAVTAPPAKTVKVRQHTRTVTPSPTQLARQQEAGYRSQGVAVERAATRQQRAAYTAAPVAQRQRTLAAGGPAAAAIRPLHDERARAHALADIGDVVLARGHKPANDLERDAVRQAVARRQRAGARAVSAALQAAGHPHQLQAPRPRTTAAGIGAALDSLLSGKTTAGAVKLAGNVAAGIVTPERWVPGLKRQTKGPAALAGRITENAAREVIDLPANAIPSVYVPAREVARGRPGAAARMVTQPFVETAKHPIRSFEEHPVSTALMLAGAVRAPSLAAGKVGRTVTGRVGERPAATVPGTQLEQVRLAAKGAVGRAVQRRRDVRAGPPVMSEPQIRRRVDETFAATEDIRRAERAQTHREATTAVTGKLPLAGGPAARARTYARNRREGSKPTAATVLEAQNITTAALSDIRAYLSQLERAAPRLKGAKAKANAAARKQLKAALAGHHAGKSEVAARRFAALSVRQQNELVRAGLLAPEQAERARLTPYAVQRMGATHDRERGLVVERTPSTKERDAKVAELERQAAQLRRVSDHQREQLGHSNPSLLARAKQARDEAQRLREGGAVREPLSTDAIRAHMKAHNVSEPAFVPQGPNVRGARNFFVATHEASRIPAATRTGEAVRTGTADIHPDVLVESAVRAQGLITTAKRYPAFLGEFGLRAKSGRLKGFTTHERAAGVAADLEATTGMAWRPVRVSPFGAKKIQTETLLERASDATHPAFQQVNEALHSALEGDGSGPWALIPEAAAKRAQEHVRTLGPGPGGRVADIYGSMFRRTVLSLSPKWLTGNVVEAALRSMVARAGPRSYLTGRRALKRLEAIDPAAAMEARARITGGGHYSLGVRSSVHTNAEHFAGTRLARVATALGKLRRTPGPKQAADAWNAYTDFVFNQMNGRIESQFQTAMLGRALKDSPLMSGHVVKLSRTALDQAARGLRGTNEQAALGRAVDRMYGRYSKFSPTMKRAVAAYTPFVAWSLNAARFVLDVLPRDHPVATALLASASQASEEWRTKHGLRLFVKGAAPGWLQGSVPVPGGGKLRVSRFTPFGAFGSPTETAAGSFFPQGESVLAALKGFDWKGHELKHADGTPYDEYERALAAALTMVEGSVPGAGQVARYKGREGSPGQRLRAEFDPFKATAPPASASAGIVIEPKVTARAGEDRLTQLRRAAAARQSAAQASNDRLMELRRAAAARAASR